MKPVTNLMLSAVILALAGTSSHALAVTAQKTVRANSASSSLALTSMASGSDSYISDSSTSFNKLQSKTYQFDLSSKWGVKFDVSQPEMSPSGINDIDAGAFYKLTPSLRVGGSLGFGEKSDPLKSEAGNAVVAQDARKQPRVRLETTFKF
ncbi:NtrZ family periplasmic regulatory protein [Asticcacaulis sp. EMRT-3]|uniref:NtrZ family periplasmic regulatory protein n=1 Tax=Asticcacaulis sp. EMRT-3 TaxID=3040349 RepID=UPI0024AF8256|nr:hypothetical protein [Asticcacaulis sp. EMRT-3]MDI7775805.1 hypothetical protein [Asticcacaulis sp. EMRT-3]